MERLLILDDDRDVAKIIKMISESCGLAARVLDDQLELLGAIDDWRPTYISLDLVMPGKTGMQMLAELARHRTSAKIIITSGMGDRDLGNARSAAEDGGLSILAVLAKPFSSAALRRILVDASGGGPHPSADPRQPLLTKVS